MEALTQFFNDILQGVKPLVQQYVELLIPPMVVIIALVSVTKKIIGNKPKRPKWLWQVITLAYGCAYSVILFLMKPEVFGLAEKTDVVKAIVVFGIGITIGAVNVLLYDAYGWYKHRKKANGN